MAKETQIGKLVIDLQIKTQALEKGLETTKKKLQEIEKQNEQVQNSNNQLDASFIAMSASIVASLVKITSAIDEGVAKYNQYTNSMNALKKTVEATDNSMTEVKESMEDVNEFKFIDDADLSKSMQNLIKYGFSVEQATEMLKVMQDAAIGNKQDAYSLSEAIRVTTEGIRMENSVLSDASGIQKNISVMYEEYAKKIGKSTDALTQAEKVQAVYNGYMDEAKDFIGTASEMASSYQGQQAQLNAVSLELSRTLGESMIPTLTEISSLQLSIMKDLTEFIKEHKSATSGVVTFTTALLATVVAVTAVKKAVTAYTTATGLANATTQALTASVMANPLFIGGLALSAAIAALAAFNTEMQETIDKMDEMTETSKTVTELLQNFRSNDMTYTESEASQASDIVEQTKQENIELREQLEQRKKMIQETNEAIQYEESQEIINESRLERLQESLRQQEDSVKELQKQINFYDKRVETLNKTLDINATKQEYATLTNQKAHRETLINIAQTKADIQGKQQLLNVLKKGKTATDEYSDAKSQLVKVYPELAKVNENTIASTQAMIDAENAAADAEWVLAQTQIQKSIIDLQTIIGNKEEYTKIAQAMQLETWEVTASLRNQINVLSNLAKLTPEDFKGSVTSNYSPKASKISGSTSSAYQNKQLDNYKALIEYKKSLDQISLKEEISMYQKALNSYAKTTEEKRELRTKIYELNKELAQKEKELLDQQTEDYEAYIQEQINNRGAAYDVKEQTKDYDAIIKMHKNYLNQIMKDERLSLDERKEIYREELQVIRDYEQQKRDLRVESIDNTVTQLTNAITKQLEEMQEKDKEFIDKQIEEVERLKEIRINAINAEYDAKIEAIEKELEALDKAEQQKSRDEEDAEYEKKKKRLEELVAFEHDATNKANYQKELDKLIAEYQKTLDERALEDKKEALNAEKELLQEEQDNKIQAIEDEVEKQKELYEEQLENLEKYYEEQMDMAQQTAEKMLLNVGKNQDKIIELLKTYGDKYEITGQSLGEKLAQGINNGIASKIENIIQKIQDTIDNNLEAKIKEWTSSSYKYEAGANKPQTTSVNVTQNNYIEQNPELPSETYRKLNNVSQNLAAEIAGM